MPTSMEMCWSLSLVFAVLELMSLQPRVTSSQTYSDISCEKVNVCICSFPTGQGVNLTKAADKLLMYNDVQHKRVFYYSPCGVTFPGSPCGFGNVLCVQNTETNATTILGGIIEPTIHFNSQGIDYPIFLYTEIIPFKTEILLECWDKSENSFMPNSRSGQLDDGLNFHFVLKSREACLKQVKYPGNNHLAVISTGAVFVIVLVILWVIYIFLGAVIKRILQGATGWEMIPNLGFWRSLPRSCMNGLRYVANGCRHRPTYEEI